MLRVFTLINSLFKCCKLMYQLILLCQSESDSTLPCSTMQSGCAGTDDFRAWFGPYRGYLGQAGVHPRIHRPPPIRAHAEDHGRRWMLHLRSDGQSRSCRQDSLRYPRCHEYRVKLASHHRCVDPPSIANIVFVYDACFY